MSASSDSLKGLLFGDVYLNPHFFKRGLIVVSALETASETHFPDTKSFQINGREFLFHKPGKEKEGSRPKPPFRSVKKAITVFDPLIRYARSQDETVVGADENSPILFNRKRHDELFLPLVMGDEPSAQGMYVYPWTSGRNSPDTTFLGFRQYISAGCLMGAGLQGVTQSGDCYSLINHQLSLPEGQKIETIVFSETAGNPFEQVLFFEFEKHCQLIKTFSNKEHNPQLLYHLPVPDYVLFGLKLLLKQQMTMPALEAFVSTLSKHQLNNRAKLLETAVRYSVDISFSSPFQPLFNEHLENQSPVALLEQAGIEFLQPTEDSEHRFVAFCLSRLVEGDSTLAKAWQTFLSVASPAPKTLEDVFRLGNAVLVATGAIGHAGHEVCSLLPLSEKQIQVHYDMLRKNIGRDSSLPAIINLTTFEPVVSFSSETNGLLFYFANPSGSLCNLMNETAVLSKASRNIGLFAKKTSHAVDTSHSPEKLETLLHGYQNAKSPLK